MTDLQQLKQIFFLSLSDPIQADRQLKQVQTVAGHASSVLKLVASLTGTGEEAVRQAAAVHFKNLVKKGWAPPQPSNDGEVDEVDTTEGIRIDAAERSIIKEHLVQLMCTSPAQIQKQLSEAIALIAKTDYHRQWESLLPSLVRQFEAADMHTIIGVLETANSVFKMFRYVGRTDQLYEIIKYTLAHVSRPLTVLMQRLGNAMGTPEMQQNRLPLSQHMYAIRLILRIVYSLNYQDLPEEFEDDMGTWMAEFAKYLQVGIFPVLEDPNEDDQPSDLDNVQAAIVDMLQLYADKDEELFVEKYVESCTMLVWNRLMSLTSKPKHDMLVTKSIRYLASLVKKLMYKKLFETPGTLESMVAQIVIPNLRMRDSDEERFEDDPHEFMVTEVEGSDSESRRTCVQELLNSMCRNLEERTTEICQQHIQVLLQEAAAGNWKSKDVAIHLFMSIAIKRVGMEGVAELNPTVNLLDFFNTQIMPELQDTNHQQRPVVKAAAIKFISTFRKQYGRNECVHLMPSMIGHLSSPVVVVHTFAAHAIERILSTKNEDRTAKMGAEQLRPFMEPLFQGLFTIIDNTEWNENEYVMKCVMRSLMTLRQEVLPITNTVIQKLVSALEHVSKNPRSPQFNHYLFESLAVLVKSVCQAEPNAVTTFETILQGPFTSILAMDVAEFTPYVFQIFGQLLELRTAQTGLGDFFTGFFEMLKAPANWEKGGNIPALSRLLKAYIEQAPTELYNSNQLTGILGIFQKLMTTNKTEAQGILILNAVIVNFDPAALQNYFSEIFRILLMRLSRTKSAKYKSLFVSFLGLFAAKMGGTVLTNILESHTPGLTNHVVEVFWSQVLLTNAPTQRIDAKIQVVGATRFLFENGGGASLLDKCPAGFVQLVAGVVKILSSPSLRNQVTTVGVDDTEETIGVYDAQFSELVNARASSAKDPFPERVAIEKDFMTGLAQLSQQRPGVIGNLMNSTDSKVQQNFLALLQNTGTQIA